MRVRQARLEAGLSRRQLAMAVGSSEQAIQTWERGTREPKLRYLKSLSEATGKPYEFFIEVAA